MVLPVCEYSGARIHIISVVRDGEGAKIPHTLNIGDSQLNVRRKCWTTQ